MIVVKDSTLVRHATCSCGRLRLEATGDPVRISICHCLDCQRRTGSVFAAAARYPSEDVTISGDSKEFTRVADSGNRITFFFCPNCGSTVHYRIDNQPDLTAITLGAFADPGFPSPTVSVYEDRRHPWVKVPDQWEHLD